MRNIEIFSKENVINSLTDTNSGDSSSTQPKMSWEENSTKALIKADRLDKSYVPQAAKYS